MAGVDDGVMLSEHVQVFVVIREVLLLAQEVDLLRALNAKVVDLDLEFLEGEATCQLVEPDGLLFVDEEIVNLDVSVVNERDHKAVCDSASDVGVGMPLVGS